MTFTKKLNVLCINDYKLYIVHKFFLHKMMHHKFLRYKNILHSLCIISYRQITKFN